jgi:hypothetical protein
LLPSSLRPSPPPLRLRPPNRCRCRRANSVAVAATFA